MATRSSSVVAVQLGRKAEGVDDKQACRVCNNESTKAIRRCQVGVESETMVVTVGANLVGERNDDIFDVVARSEHRYQDGSTRVEITTRPLYTTAANVDSCGQTLKPKCTNCIHLVVDASVTVAANAVPGVSAPYPRTVVTAAHCGLPAEGIEKDGRMVTCDKVARDFDPLGEKESCWSCRFRTTISDEPGLHATPVRADIGPYAMLVVRNDAEAKGLSGAKIGMAINQARLDAGMVAYRNGPGAVVTSLAWKALMRTYQVSVVEVDWVDVASKVVRIPEVRRRWIPEHNIDGFATDYYGTREPVTVPGRWVDETVTVVRPLTTVRKPRAYRIRIPGSGVVGWVSATGYYDSIEDPIRRDDGRIVGIVPGGIVTPGEILPPGDFSQLGWDERCEIDTMQILSPYHREWGLADRPEWHETHRFAKVPCSRCGGYTDDDTGEIVGGVGSYLAMKQDWTKGTPVMWRDWRTGIAMAGSVGCGDCGGKEDGQGYNKGSGMVTFIPEHRPSPPKGAGRKPGAVNCSCADQVIHRGGKTIVVPGVVCYFHAKGLTRTETKAYHPPDLMTGRSLPTLEHSLVFATPAVNGPSETNPARILKLVRDGTNSRIVDGNGDPPTPVLLRNWLRNIALVWRLDPVERKALMTQYDTTMADRSQVEMARVTERANLGWILAHPGDPWKEDCAVNRYDTDHGGDPDGTAADYGASRQWSGVRGTLDRGIDFAAEDNDSFGTPRGAMSTNPVTNAMVGGVIEMLTEDKDVLDRDGKPIVTEDQPARIGEYGQQIEAVTGGRKARGAWLNIGGLKLDPSYSWPKAQASQAWQIAHAPGVPDQVEALVTAETIRRGQAAPMLTIGGIKQLVPRHNGVMPPVTKLTRLAPGLPGVKLMFRSRTHETCLIDGFSEREAHTLSAVDDQKMLVDYLDSGYQVRGGDGAKGFTVSQRFRWLGYSNHGSRSDRGEQHGIVDRDIASMFKMISDNDDNTANTEEFYVCDTCWRGGEPGSVGAFGPTDIVDADGHCPTPGCHGMLQLRGQGREWLGAVMKVTRDQMAATEPDLPRMGSPTLAVAADSRSWSTRQRLMNRVCVKYESRQRRRS